MGRPVELDDLKAQRICNAIAAGNTRQCAAQAAGIGLTTLKEWARRGRDGEAPFASFASRLEKADAEAEERHVRNIETAAESGTWQASAWWLERRRRHAWRRPAIEQAPQQNDDLSQVPSELLEQAVIAAQQLRKKANHG